MFVDKVKLSLEAGDGGNGIVAFRREKYVPMGGPAGGDGGHGSNIIFKGDRNLSTLLDLRYNKIIKGKKGENGMSKRCHGKDALPTIIRVPVGTIIKDANDELIADITKDEQEVIIAHGGRGGRGNVRFATNKVPAPDICENGEPGEKMDVIVELKLLADVGLVGLPSVGKSTFLSVVTAAKPEIADYHFTTIVPNLGVVKSDDGNSFVMADLPGLIEGASQGKGLGIQFLRHIERCRVIVHIVDMAAVEGRDPIDDFEKINKELEEYNPSLMKRPMIVIANKLDLDTFEDNYNRFYDKYRDKYEIFKVSTLTHIGLKEVLYRISTLLQENNTIYETFDTVKVYRFEDEDAFEINKEDGVYILSGPKVERLFVMTNFNTEEGIARFARKMRYYGIDDALREKGCQNGDLVRIDDFVFEFIE
ncbi:GTP-binding protein [Bacilli bacterium PM5-3]|nr:GTP-binding protein [Bacilli bacterium PM5-3]MDH6603101.1 GTP-binding protein [Bacilli bacterium PM5-9]